MQRLVRMLGFWGAIAMALLCVRAWAAPPAKRTELPGLALGSHRASVGAPIGVGNLTVFPIYAVSNPKFADAVALDHALRRGKARVRELGSDDTELTNAQVGTLVIDNLDDRPIVVLAGTVVKGGKQDRQIAQDFVIAANDSVDVEAFCVEQGRWSGERDGKSTGGSFSGSGMIAPTKVRIAAQYEGDQGKVWDEVAGTNASSKKNADSGTLMATYDDKKMKAKRKAVAEKVAAAIAEAPSTSSILGVAYAIDGEIRGVRWFGARVLFDQHRTQLLETMAMESLLAPARQAPAKRPTAKQVVAFVDGVASTAVKATKSRPKTMNTNVYKESKRAFSSEARLQDTADPMTVDISAK